MGVVTIVLLAGTRMSAAQETVDYARALPAASDLPGFTDIDTVHHKTLDKSSDGSTVYAIRDTDGLRLHATIAVQRDIESAGKVVFNSIRTPEQLLPPGSHTGRKFGDEIWHSVDPRGGPVRGLYRLVTRMDRAVVVIDIYRKVERVDGNPVWPLVDEVDAKFIEDLTIGCLQRLVKMGIGTQAAATPIDAPPVSDVLREVIAPVGVTPGFAGVRYRAVPRGEDEIEVTRRRDGTRMVVHLSISAEIGEAMTKARTVASSQTGKLSAGSLTGRVFGNELWHAVSSREDGGRNLSLVTRMGSAVVRVDLIERGNKQPADGVGTTSAENDDMKLAEEVTVGCLKRLVARGIGSHGATFFRDPPPPPRP